MLKLGMNLTNNSLERFHLDIKNKKMKINEFLFTSIRMIRDYSIGHSDNFDKMPEISTGTIEYIELYTVKIIPKRVLPTKYQLFQYKRSRFLNLKISFLSYRALKSYFFPTNNELFFWKPDLKTWVFLSNLPKFSKTATLSLQNYDYSLENHPLTLGY